MRQGQQNRRGRGRNNRKGQSPINRSFESNGPDVKIRGTPAHIGEKYLSLARDAAASGDPVLAENYLQHAEHYNRIIMSAREQAMGPGGEYMNGMGRSRPAQETGEGGDDFGEDEGDDFGDALVPRGAHETQQPRVFEGNHRQDDRPYRRGPDYGRSSARERNTGDQRGPMGERPRPERSHALGGDQPGESFAPSSRHEAPPRRRERYQPRDQHEQPEFLRRPVRRPRREANGVEANEDGDRPAAVAAEDEGNRE